MKNLTQARTKMWRLLDDIQQSYNEKMRLTLNDLEYIIYVMEEKEKKMKLCLNTSMTSCF